MTDEVSRWYVLIPCSKTESWAVPQNCLAEILTIQAKSGQPPDEVSWRGQTVPVLDFGCDDGSGWREPQRGTGLIAIFLGLEGEGCDYWGLAVRGEGLVARRIEADEVENAPEAMLQHAAAALRLQGDVYQVPDLDALQKQIAVSQNVA